MHVDSVDSIDSCDRQGVSWIRKITLNTSGTWVFEVWIHQEPEYSRSEYIRNLRIQKYSWILEYVLIFSSWGSAPQLTLCVINIKYITRFWNTYVLQSVLYFLLYFLLYFVLFWWSPANWLMSTRCVDVWIIYCESKRTHGHMACCPTPCAELICAKGVSSAQGSSPCGPLKRCYGGTVDQRAAPKITMVKCTSDNCERTARIQESAWRRLASQHCATLLCSWKLSMWPFEKVLWWYCRPKGSPKDKAE